MNNQQQQQQQEPQNAYKPYTQAFNEGYSKACFDIGFSQGYNSGYQTGMNQGYWNATNQDCNNANNNNNNNIEFDNTACNRLSAEDISDINNKINGTEINGTENNERDSNERENNEHEIEVNDNPFDDNPFDDNMEIDFEWYSQDNEYQEPVVETNPIYTPLFDTSNTIWNVVKTDEQNDEDKADSLSLSDSFYKNINISKIFNSYEPISWNVIKEDPLQEVSTNLFNYENFENPFISNMDSDIFSSFSWGDILTNNIDTSYEYNNDIFQYESIPCSPTKVPIMSELSMTSFPIIQEDSGDEEEQEDEDEDIDSYASDEIDDIDEIDEIDDIDDIDDIDSWVLISEEKKEEPKVEHSSSSCSYSFNFDSCTSSEEQNDNKQALTNIFEFNKEYDYTAKECDEISLDSSISSEEIVEDDLNVVSFSMPSLQISFDDRQFTYFDENINIPARRLPLPIPPLSPIKRAYQK